MIVPDIKKVKPGGKLEFIGTGDGYTGEFRVFDGTGKKVAAFSAVSGNKKTSKTSQQERMNVSGKLYPLPDGTYPMSPIEIGSFDVGEWMMPINNYSGNIGNRGGILIHNDLGSPGTAGCIGIEGIGGRGSDKSMKLAQLLQIVQPTSVKVELSSDKGASLVSDEDTDGDSVEEDEQNRDGRNPNGRTSTSNVLSQFAKFGEYGRVALEFLQGAQAALGLDLFGDLSGGGGSEQMSPSDSESPNIAPSRQRDDGPLSSSPEVLQSEEEKPKSEKEQASLNQIKIKDNVLQKLKKASHPDTGSGYTVAGLKDYKNRPAIFSQAAAYFFGKMMAESGGAVRGSDISSSKRSRAKNNSLPGAHPNSSHLYGEALDVINPTMNYMKAHGPKYHWKFGYHHGKNSAHFDYKGPEKLSADLLKAQKKQKGGIVGMQGGGTVASQFNEEYGHATSNKYSRPIVIVKSRGSSISEPAPTSKLTDTNDTFNMQASQMSTSMYKIQMGTMV